MTQEEDGPTQNPFVIIIIIIIIVVEINHSNVSLIITSSSTSSSALPSLSSLYQLSSSSSSEFSLPCLNNFWHNHHHHHHFVNKEILSVHWRIQLPLQTNFLSTPLSLPSAFSNAGRTKKWISEAVTLNLFTPNCRPIVYHGLTTYMCWARLYVEARRVSWWWENERACAVRWPTVSCLPGSESSHCVLSFSLSISSSLSCLTFPSLFLPTFPYLVSSSWLTPSSPSPFSLLHISTVHLTLISDPYILTQSTQPCPTNSTLPSSTFPTSRHSYPTLYSMADTPLPQPFLPTHTCPSHTNNLALFCPHSHYISFTLWSV